MDLLDHPVIGGRYFFPRPDGFVAGDTPAEGCHLHVASGDATLDCYWRVVDPDAVTLVHFHGNGEVVGDYVGGFADTVAAQGLNLLLAEFRGYGQSTGSPDLGAMLQDVAAVVAAADLDPARVVFMGRSVGSIYAIHAVSVFANAAGLVLESGIASPLERILLRAAPQELGVTRTEMEAAFAAQLDHQRKLAGWTGPTLLLHARHDDLVRLDHAERNASWCAGATTLEIFERGDHNSIFAYNAAAYLQLLFDFCAKCSPASN